MTEKKVSIKVFFNAEKFNEGIKKAKINLKNFKKVGTAITGAGLAMAGALGASVKVAGDFSASMANVSTLIDTNSESMDKMKKEVLKMSTQMPVSITDLSTSLYDIRSAGISAADAMSTLKQSAILSKAGLSTVSDATNIMTSAMNAFSAEGLSAEQISNILFKTVKAGKTTIAQLSQSFGANAAIVSSAGVKLADFQAATAALTTVGTPASQAQNQLRAAIVALQKPTENMQAVFKKLGVTTGQELLQKTGSLGAAFEAVKSTAEGLGLNVSQVAESVEAASAITSIATATNKTYNETLLSMTSGTNEINEAYKKQTAEFNASIQVLTNQLQAFAISIGTVLIPTIQSMSNALSGLIGWFNNLPGPVKEAIAQVALLATGLALIAGPILTVIGFIPSIIAGFTAVAGVIGTVVTVMAGLPAIIAAVVVGLAALIYFNWDEIKKIGTNLVKGIWKGIKDASAWIGSKLKEFGEGVTQKIKDVFGIKSPSKVMKEIGKNLVEGLKAGIKSSQYMAEDAMDQIGFSLTNRALTWKQVIIKSLMGIGEAYSKNNKGFLADMTGRITTSYNSGNSIKTSLIKGIGNSISTSFLGLPLFHTGGIVSKANIPGTNETMAILKVGETVRTPQQEAALNKGAVIINFAPQIHCDDPIKTKKLLDQYSNKFISDWINAVNTGKMGVRTAIRTAL